MLVAVVVARGVFSFAVNFVTGNDGRPNGSIAQQVIQPEALPVPPLPSRLPLVRLHDRHLPHATIPKGEVALSIGCCEGTTRLRRS